MFTGVNLSDGIAFLLGLSPGAAGCTFHELAFTCGCDITNSCPSGDDMFSDKFYMKYAVDMI